MPLIPGEAESDRSLSSKPAWTTDLQPELHKENLFQTTVTPHPKE